MKHIDFKEAFKNPIMNVDKKRLQGLIRDECEKGKEGDTVGCVMKRAYDRLAFFPPGGMVSEKKLKKSSGKFGK